MKIAFCLHGQPRRFEEGHAVFQRFIQQQPQDCEVDFFFHSWLLPEGKTQYDCSIYRKIREADLIELPNIQQRLLELYKPKAYQFEYQRVFDPTPYKDTIGYRNTREYDRKYSANMISQLYSLWRAKDVFREYQESTQTKYDMVISARFDFIKDIPIIIRPEFINKVVMIDHYYPRYILNGTFMMLPPEVYLTWMNMYCNLKYILDNKKIEMVMKKIGENLLMVTESIYTASYIMLYRNLNNVVYNRPIVRFYRR
jgi:hypothetical protein